MAFQWCAEVSVVSRPVSRHRLRPSAPEVVRSAVADL